jgi:phage protein D
VPDDRAKESAPELTIAVDGTELPHEVTEALVALRVEESLDAAGMFALTLANADLNSTKPKWSDDDRFRVGGKVEIKMGPVGEQEPLMVGEITGLEPAWSGRRSLFTVRGYDRLHRLRRGRKTRSFLDVKDSQVAEQIAGELGLQSEVEDSREVHPYLFQNNQTNVDFLMMRARAVGYELQVADRKLFFRKRRYDRGKVVSLEWGKELESFYPVLTTVPQAQKVVVRGWDRKNKEALVGTASAGDISNLMQGSTLGAKEAQTFGDAEVHVVDQPVASAAEAEQMAKGILEGLALTYVTGEGTTVGNPAIRAGTVVELTELGKRFSGLYYVTATQHVRDTLGFRTHFTVRRNAA